jgi:alkanesulfonate monooxygenase SsuD/methylene tetrahydromethanopterin reductase-like flavin-dependent oxidoreductase (luciferase family)
MDFGINFFPVLPPALKSAQQYYSDAIELSMLADQLGFKHVQTVEHYGTSYGGYCPDPVTLLAAIGARTERIRLTTGAVIPAFTHPIKLAAKLAMLDNLTGGRLDAGFGRGFLPEEFSWFGVPMEESRRRFEEGICACVQLWSEENVVWDGEFHQFGPITLLPRPLQQPYPPVFVASATSTESCAAAGAAGRHLQLVPTVTSAEQLADMLAAYRSAWTEAGNAADTAQIQIKYTCYLGDDRSETLAVAARWEHNYVDQMANAVASWATARSAEYPGYEKFVDKVRNYDFDSSLRQNKVLAGTTEDVRKQLIEIAGRLGTNLTVSLQFNPGATECIRARRSMESFAREVMPEFS